MRAMCCEWGLRLSRGAAAVAMAVMPGLAAAHAGVEVMRWNTLRVLSKADRVREG